MANTRFIGLGINLLDYSFIQYIEIKDNSNGERKKTGLWTGEYRMRTMLDYV
jgi:hypothetical protein